MSGFHPAKKTYGEGHSRMFFAKVISRDDPEQRGRVKIQLLGGFQDEGDTDNSYWANPVFNATNPMNGGIGGPGTGAMEGSVITGFFAADGMPLFYGSIAASNTDDESQDPIGVRRKHDINMHSRDKEKKGGDIRFDQDQKDYGHESVTVYARDQFPNPHGRRHTIEYNEDNSWSLGSYQFKNV